MTNSATRRPILPVAVNAAHDRCNVQELRQSETSRKSLTTATTTAIRSRQRQRVWETAYTPVVIGGQPYNYGEESRWLDAATSRQRGGTTIVLSAAAGYGDWLILKLVRVSSLETMNNLMCPTIIGSGSFSHRQRGIDRD